jgi:hypothetical protein
MCGNPLLVSYADSDLSVYISHATPSHRIYQRICQSRGEASILYYSPVYPALVHF